MMNANTRREKLLSHLKSADSAVNGTQLAGLFEVSRQVIVGDIALLRASGKEILSTPQGYIFGSKTGGLLKKIVCIHNTESIEDELNTIVDNGCEVIDVIIEHAVYGELSGKLEIANRYDVKSFVHALSVENAPPLSLLTGGVHIHTLRCPDEESFSRVLNQLEKKGYIYSDKD